MVLDAEVQDGKAHAAKHSLPRLRQVLESLPLEKRWRLVRGDNAFGNDPVMAEMEALSQDYLAKLRQTAGVKRLIERQWSRQDWQNVGLGFNAVEGELRLAGWRQVRRVMVMRGPVNGSLMAKEKSAGKQTKPQQSLHFADPIEPVKLWEYAVLVTNANDALEAISQLYCDRGDCENGFDERINQWGWGGWASWTKSAAPAST